MTYLPVDENGRISLADFDAALDDDTILVTIMMGNNEVGSRMPISEIGARLVDHQAWFHTDATQAFGLLDIDVQAQHIDMLSVSAHKINGPKGIGFLYRDPKVQFPSLLKGGEQELKRRAGTENIAGIAVSGGSACTAGSLEPSHVLTAMFGADSPRLGESIRLSFGAQTTKADIQAFIDALLPIVQRLQAKQSAR